MKPVARHTQLNRAYPIPFLDKPEELIKKENDLIVKIYKASGFDDDEWEVMTLPAVLNLAKFVQLLPASTDHHHSEEGGLFRHSLETGYIAMLKARNRTLSRYGDTAQMMRAKNYWNHAALLGGFYHDLGKTISNFAVFNRADHSRWRPMKESLWQWGVRTGVKEYCVISLLRNDFADKEDPLGSREAKDALASAPRKDLHESYITSLVLSLIPEEYKNWFDNIQKEDILEFLVYALTKESDESEDPLKKCIREADQESTSNYVRNNTDFPASQTSLNIVTAFFTGVTFALNHKFWTVNRADSEVFVLQQKCFIDWNRIKLNNLAAFLEKNGQDAGFIHKKEELAEWLINNHLAYANRISSPDGKLKDTPYFTIHPFCSGPTPLKAVWLTRSPFEGLVPSIPGMIKSCTDVPSRADDDEFFQEDDDNPEENERFYRRAQKIRENEETEIFNQTRSNITEKFDAEKEAKVKARREQTGKTYRVRTASSVIDLVLKWFGLARFFDTDIVSESPVDNDLPVRRPSAVDKTFRDDNSHQQDDVIIQGVSEEFAAKKVGYNKEDYRNAHPEVRDSEPLFHYGEDWKSFKKFPKPNRFSDSDFIIEGEKEKRIKVLDSVPSSFSVFKSKKTNRFLWKYYPFAYALAAFTTDEHFASITFAVEENSILLKEKLKIFFKEGLIPYEIFPAPVHVRVPKVDEDGIVRSDEEEIQVRTPDFEKDGDVIAKYVNFYRKALENFKIGREAGCFPTTFKDAEFYPLFIELAALYLNEVVFGSIDKTQHANLVCTLYDET